MPSEVKDIVLTLWRLHFKNVELWCLCCMMMFRWTNKQPGIQKFWNLCSHYQDTCKVLWLNITSEYKTVRLKPYQLPFILLQTAVYGEKWVRYIKSSHLSIFPSLKHLMVLLRCIFFGASFLHLIKDTDSM